MNPWISVFLSLISWQALARDPDVLECTVAFQSPAGTKIQVRPLLSSAQNIRVLDSGAAPGSRWITLLRLTGNSVSDFQSSIRFQSQELQAAVFHLQAESGRSFGQVQLFNLEVSSREEGDSKARTAKAELVAKSSPPELNSYASLKGEPGLRNSNVLNYEINCGSVGWSFGGFEFNRLFDFER